MPPQPGLTPQAEESPREEGHPPRSRALAGRLMRVIFGCYIVVAVALTGLQMAVEYRRASARLHEDVTALGRTFSPGLADAMWRFNAEVLSGILRGMKEIPVVLGAEVRDEHGVRIQAVGTITDRDGRSPKVDTGETSSSEVGFGTPFSHTFGLVHTEGNGQRYPVGSWTVYSNDDIAIDQVKNTLIVILINSAIKSLVLWLIFYVVIRRMIGRPLSQIGAFLDRLDVENLGTRPLVIASGGRHELHALTAALNTMVGRLRRAFEENGALMRELREINGTLQARVAARTRDLERLARTDLLTGLFNRRKLDEAIEAGADEVRRHGGALCVILGDVDHFKAINDRHGHKAGDAVLTAFAAVLRDGVRPADTLGRWGGEEFMVVCPDTDLAGAMALAERLRRRIESHWLPAVGARTCSFGVAELRPDESTDSLVTRADAALYRCKRNGRNRVEASGEPPAEDAARERGAA